LAIEIVVGNMEEITVGRVVDCAAVDREEDVEVGVCVEVVVKIMARGSVADWDKNDWGLEGDGRFFGAGDSVVDRDDTTWRELPERMMVVVDDDVAGKLGTEDDWVTINSDNDVAELDGVRIMDKEEVPDSLDVGLVIDLEGDMVETPKLLWTIDEVELAAAAGALVESFILFDKLAKVGSAATAEKPLLDLPLDAVSDELTAARVVEVCGKNKASDVDGEEGSLETVEDLI
jgi:hypothetical protein